MYVTVAAFLLCVCIAPNVMAMASRIVCKRYPDIGPCPNKLPRWYHVNGVCKEFVYGGCGGNPNNFLSWRECNHKCVVCNLRFEPGDYPGITRECRQYVERFYFDNGRCRRFVYNGCGGNDNNFNSEKNCRRSCLIQERKYERMEEYERMLKHQKHREFAHVN